MNAMVRKGLARLDNSGVKDGFLQFEKTAVKRFMRAAAIRMGNRDAGMAAILPQLTPESNWAR